MESSSGPAPNSPVKPPRVVGDTIGLRFSLARLSLCLRSIKAMPIQTLNSNQVVQLSQFDNRSHGGYFDGYLVTIHFECEILCGTAHPVVASTIAWSSDEIDHKDGYVLNNYTQKRQSFPDCSG